MNSDFSELLQCFIKHRVRYLVVGGYAVIHYAQPRFTKDLDLWVEPSLANSRKVAAAFYEFGIPLIEVTEQVHAGAATRDAGFPNLHSAIGFWPLLGAAETSQT
jgi:hypothetical protein